MGIVLVIGMMAYSVGLCLFFQRFSDPGPDVLPSERLRPDQPGPVVIPDRVPAAWVDTYRAEPGG